MEKNPRAPKWLVSTACLTQPRPSTRCGVCSPRRRDSCCLGTWRPGQLCAPPTTPSSATTSAPERRRPGRAARGRGISTPKGIPRTRRVSRLRRALRTRRVLTTKRVLGTRGGPRTRGVPRKVTLRPNIRPNLRPKLRPRHRPGGCPRKLQLPLGPSWGLTRAGRRPGRIRWRSRRRTRCGRCFRQGARAAAAEEVTATRWSPLFPCETVHSNFLLIHRGII
mmetsp:Transcript_4509/g.11118  ORF Transcript_4509/g.11118 Transcript_4509/m.11118 type:complete len:222 (+) Transcript_4509:318-983(+)